MPTFSASELIPAADAAFSTLARALGDELTPWIVRENPWPESTTSQVARPSTKRVAPTSLQLSNRTGLPELDPAFHSLSWQAASEFDGRGRSHAFPFTLGDRTPRECLHPKPSPPRPAISLWGRPRPRTPLARQPGPGEATRSPSCRLDASRNRRDPGENAWRSTPYGIAALRRRSAVARVCTPTSERCRFLSQSDLRARR